MIREGSGKGALWTNEWSGAESTCLNTMNLKTTDVSNQDSWDTANIIINFLILVGWIGCTAAENGCITSHPSDINEDQCKPGVPVLLGYAHGTI